MLVPSINADKINFFIVTPLLENFSAQSLRSKAPSFA